MSTTSSNANRRQLPSWSEFTGADRIFDQLNEIARFTLFAAIPPLVEFSNEGRYQDAASRIYAIVAETLQNAKFYRAENLDIRMSSGKTLQLTYDDDVFDFAIQVGDGRLILERRGSSFEVFHEWYMKLGPQFWDMFSKITTALTEVTGRKINISRAYFSFFFYLLNLAVDQPGGRRVLNYEIMSRLLRGLPDDQGGLSEEEEEVLRSAGRVDITFSRWLKDGDREWIERYELQAPANRGGERLECDFTYMGETASRSERDERKAFQAQDFLERYDTAYGQFLRNRVIRKFLTDLLRNYSFRAVRALQ